MKRILGNWAGLSILTVLACPTADANIITFDGALNSSQVVAGGGSTSIATGFATVAIDTTLFTVTSDLSWANLTGPTDRAHLHNAPAGQLTDELFFHELIQNPTLPCGFVSSNSSGFCLAATGTTHDVLQLSISDGYGVGTFADLVALFEADGVYVDVHTGAYPEGEIRGQLMPVPEPSICALLAAGLGLLGFTAHRRKRRD